MRNANPEGDWQTSYFSKGHICDGLIRKTGELLIGSSNLVIKRGDGVSLQPEGRERISKNLVQCRWMSDSWVNDTICLDHLVTPPPTPPSVLLSPVNNYGRKTIIVIKPNERCWFNLLR